MARKGTDAKPTLRDLVEHALELAVAESKARGYQGRELRRIIVKLEACQQLLNEQEQAVGGPLALRIEPPAPGPLRKSYATGDARGVLLQRLAVARRAAVTLARSTGWRLVGRVATKLAACEHVITDPDCYRFDVEWESGEDWPSWKSAPLAARASGGSPHRPSLPSDRTDNSFPDQGLARFARVRGATDALEAERNRSRELSQTDREMDERDERARRRLEETYGAKQVEEQK